MYLKFADSLSPPRGSEVLGRLSVLRVAIGSVQYDDLSDQRTCNRQFECGAVSHVTSCIDSLRNQWSKARTRN